MATLGFRAFWCEGFEVQGLGGQLVAPTVVSRAANAMCARYMYNHM